LAKILFPFNTAIEVSSQELSIPSMIVVSAVKRFLNL